MLKQASIAAFFVKSSGTEVCSSADSERLPISSSSEESEHSDTDSESDGGEVPSDVCKPNVVTVNDAECSQPLTSTDQCSSECCDEGLSSPYHPKINFLKTKRKQGKQTRVFQSKWFDEHTWLTFCVTRNKAYCFYCRAAESRGLINFSKKAKGAFVTVGFDNWKKAKERFREHEHCPAHPDAITEVQSR